MQYSLFDFLSTALVPELSSDVAACPSCHIQGVFIPVSAVRALPDELSVLCGHDLDLSVITACLAVITLCVQLRIHDIVINVADHLKNCRNVVLHIRYFHIADGASGRQRLELGLEFQLGESVDLFSYKHVIAVCTLRTYM